MPFSRNINKQTNKYSLRWQYKMFAPQKWYANLAKFLLIFHWAHTNGRIMVSILTVNSVLNRRISNMESIYCSYFQEWNEFASQQQQAAAANHRSKKATRHKMTHRLIYTQHKSLHRTSERCWRKGRNGEARKKFVWEEIVLIEHVCLFCCVLINVLHECICACLKHPSRKHTYQAIDTD